VKDRIIIIGHGSTSKAIFAQSLQDNIVIVDVEKQNSVFDNTPTITIHNYTLANKVIEIKTGKELRRERRKSNRKNHKR